MGKSRKQTGMPSGDATLPDRDKGSIEERMETPRRVHKEAKHDKAVGSQPKPKVVEVQYREITYVCPVRGKVTEKVKVNIYASPKPPPPGKLDEELEELIYGGQFDSLDEDGDA